MKVLACLPLLAGGKPPPAEMFLLLPFLPAESSKEEVKAEGVGEEVAATGWEEGDDDPSSDH